MARQAKGQKIRYHFAGSWKDEENEAEFYTFVKEHGLEDQVIHHGFVSGEDKSVLFKQAHVLLYPSKNDAFPLTLLESLSYGVPVIATDEGSISYILDAKCGIILKDVSNLLKALKEAKETLLNKEIAKHCRKRYEENFSQKQFENNLLEVLR